MARTPPSADFRRSLAAMLESSLKNLRRLDEDAATAVGDRYEAVGDNLDWLRFRPSRKGDAPPKDDDADDDAMSDELL